MKLIVPEEGSDEMRTLAMASTLCCSARIAYVEMRAALAAARRDRRLTPAALSKARRELEAVWAATSPIEVDADLIETAGDLAESEELRGYDAVHLAALVRLGAPEEITAVACWDANLRRSAGKLGYALFPA